MSQRLWWRFLLACWLAFFGVWPFADPGHDGDSVLVFADLVLHSAGLFTLLGWWIEDRVVVAVRRLRTEGDDDQ